WDPLKVCGRLFLVSVTAIMLGVVVPGIIADMGGVFYEKPTRNMIRGQGRVELDKFEARKKELTDRIPRLKSAIESPKPDSRLTDLLEQLNVNETKLEQLKPKILVAPFYLSDIMLIWVLQYTLLGWLAVLLNPASIKPLQDPRCYLITLGLYVIYEWTIWIRNFILTDEGRKIYSYANRDIGPWSFVTQEVNSILYFFLIAVIWLQWLAFLKFRRSGLA